MGFTLRFFNLGYFAIPVEDGIPYDSKNGVVPNINGKVEPGLYCAGWLATGPRGVIVDTMNEAFKVGQTVAEDLISEIDTCEKQGFGVISDLLEQRGVLPVYFQDWEKIDAKEKAMGMPHGKPREKFTKVDQMINQLSKDNSNL